jgi:hypothetical protein
MQTVSKEAAQKGEHCQRLTRKMQKRERVSKVAALSLAVDTELHLSLGDCLGRMPVRRALQRGKGAVRLEHVAERQQAAHLTILADAVATDAASERKDGSVSCASGC